MKRVETYKGSGEFVTAMNDSDLKRMKHVIRDASEAWFSAWVRDGEVDEGSCCLGIGIDVFYLPPRARYPRIRQVIRWTWTQGDFGAERTKEVPLRMLKDAGIDARYNCGRMD
jgi:hypothetical protein